MAVGSGLGLFIPPALAETPDLPGVARPYCADQTQLGLNICAAEWAHTAEFLRSQITANLAQQLPTDLQTQLAITDAIWVTFRDQHCQAVSWPLLGGSAYPLVYNSCYAKITNDRIADLQTWGSPTLAPLLATARLHTLLNDSDLTTEEINLQARWIDYQTQHCQFERQRWPDHPQQANQCHQRLTTTRIRQLEDLLQLR